MEEEIWRVDESVICRIIPGNAETLPVEKGREGVFADRLPRTPLPPYASQRSPQGFDG
ncbi:hypothetical protein NQZ68_023824 [Dissostichus eleginoides]|nr:hypothetical protein NQZ68_023824 [Dissostichus eleginoides]